MENNGPDVAARSRLELKKLKLEIRTLRASIIESSKAPRRVALSTVATFLLSVATLGLGAAGFFLNATLAHSSEAQRSFDNYTRLTEEFAKGGPERIGAIVGFKDFLAHGSERVPQTAAILANDLFEERDPAAVRAIEGQLSAADFDALDQLRAAHQRARHLLLYDATEYLFQRASHDFASHRTSAGQAWPEFLKQWFATRGRRAVDRLADHGAYDLWRRSVLTHPGSYYFFPFRDFTRNNELLGGHGASLIDLLSRQRPSENPQHQSFYWRYAHDAQAFAVTSASLTSLFARSMKTDEINGEMVSLFDIDWKDRNFVGARFDSAYLNGIASGVNFSSASFEDAYLDVDVTPSLMRATSFCDASFVNSRAGERFNWALEHTSPLPDFKASDWWDIQGLSSRAIQRLEKAYPRVQDEVTMSRSAAGELCAHRWQTSHVPATPLQQAANHM